jgi:hypothetical protein
LDYATGDELDNDGDDDNARDDDDVIIDLTVGSEDEKALKIRKVSKCISIEGYLHAILLGAESHAFYYIYSVVIS